MKKTAINCIVLFKNWDITQGANMLDYCPKVLLKKSQYLINKEQWKFEKRES